MAVHALRTPRGLPAHPAAPRCFTSHHHHHLPCAAAVDFSLLVAKVARGGQVVFTESAWDLVKPVIQQHAGAAQVGPLGGMGCVDC